MFDTTLAALVAYLPYWTIPDGHLGPLPFHPFGLLVATGIMLGHRIATARAKTLQLNEQKFESLVFWTVATGIVLSHMLDTIFYHWDKLRENPLELFMIHHGLSSFGGFFGAIVGFTIGYRRLLVDPWRAADAIALGLPFGWVFGRLGCATVHDHPGRPSTHWLAVNFPEQSSRPYPFPPGPRFDLGVLELLLTPILCLVVVYVARKTTRRGAVVGALAFTYPFIRFPLDWFRESDANGGDVRYFGLTPGHFACVICLVIGILCLNHARKPSAIWTPKTDDPEAKKPATKKPAATVAAKKSDEEEQQPPADNA